MMYKRQNVKIFSSGCIKMRNKLLDDSFTRSACLFVFYLK